MVLLEVGGRLCIGDAGDGPVLCALAQEFLEHYKPSCDILLVQIVWGGRGGLYYIPLEIQNEVFSEVGRSGYIKLPKSGTNPRGVEIAQKALLRLVRDTQTKRIKIDWKKPDIEYHPYKRWIDYWREE